ncbi:hypothetical protein C0J52_19970 [Blattella germanica]|nr:hypothetical protein C0J52_19970 [Blattella germanica]
MFTSNQLLELMAQIMGAFQEIFNKAPLRKASLLDWERRPFAFGSVKDRLRSGRKKTREETCWSRCFDRTISYQVDIDQRGMLIVFNSNRNTKKLRELFIMTILGTCKYY